MEVIVRNDGKQLAKVLVDRHLKTGYDTSSPINIMQRVDVLPLHFLCSLVAIDETLNRARAPKAI